MLTSILILPILFMDFLVQIHVLLSLEFLPAGLARERPVVVVHHDVSQKSTASHEPEPADVTHERFDVPVYLPHVHFEISLPCKLLRAFLAGPRSLVGMADHVRLHDPNGAVAFTADFTHVFPFFIIRR